jgi:phosphopantothenoylcysteine decarboxylase/phosphopantothenate--cysteine ligase
VKKKEPDRTLEGRRILLGVTGSIAAYKAADVASQLAQRGARVTPILTRGAAQLVRPLTFQTLTGRRALTRTFDAGRRVDPTHIRLSAATELLLIAPASANTIARLALGLADDLLSTIALQVRCPLMLAPAMNQAMWRHPAVQGNLQTLRARGAIVIEPGSGYLACGEVGPGRLAEPAEIVRRVEEFFAKK